MTKLFSFWEAALQNRAADNRRPAEMVSVVPYHSFARRNRWDCLHRSFALVAHPPCFIAGKVCHIYDIGYVIYIPVVILVSPVKEHGKCGNSDGKAGICFIHEVK